MCVIRTVVCILFLFVYAVCQGVAYNDAGDGNNVDSIARAPAEDNLTKEPTDAGSSPSESSSKGENFTKPSTEISSPEISSSEGSTIKVSEDLTKPTIDTSDDIVITGTAVPDVTGSNTDQSTTPTIYDDDITTLSTTSEDEGTNKTGCSSNPCRNGGTCTEDALIPLMFSCVCPEGYVGIRCGTVDKCVEDQDGAQCKNGACVYSDDGLVRYCHCFTGTYWDEINKECREPDPPCFPNPCLNGGTCSSEDDVTFCDCPSGFQGKNCSVQNKCGDCERGTCILNDKQTTKYCKCNEGLYWNEEKQTCEDMVSPCDSSPCHNGGICDSISDTDYNCTCVSGFSGKICDIIEKCSSREDCVHGDCVLSEDKSRKTCHCDRGSYLEEQSHKCEEITNVCQPNPCLNDGICTVLSTSAYNCTCSYGYTGENCGIRDLCKMDGGNAYCDNGICSNNVDLGVYYCTCKDEEYFQYNKRKCVEITNVCQPNPCLNDGICTVLSTSAYNCTCSYGYTGENCGIRDLCKMDGGNAYCDNGICSNNVDLGVYYCTCKDEEYFQYNKRKCVDLDLCPLVECGSTESCSMGKCKCKESYQWNNVTEKCEPDFCSSNPCPLAEMNCEEGTGSTDYKCSCHEGYTFNGTHCNEVICMFPSLNDCDQVCLPKEDGYKCSCDEEFELQEDNHTCLSTGNHTCLNKTCDNGLCVQTNGLEVCMCPPSYTEVDGQCTDICSANQLPPGVCPMDECEVTKENGFRCKCEGKFVLAEDKVTCIKRNICQEQELGWKTCTDRNAECVENWESSEGFKCRCGKGQVPVEGGICRDVCSLENNQRLCSIKGASCDVDMKGRMMCSCPPYFKENERDRKCTQPADFSYSVTLPLDRSTYEISDRRRTSLDASIDYRKISNDITVTIREMFAEFTRANVLSCKSESKYILCKIEMQFSREHHLDLKRLKTEDVCLTKDDSNKCLLPPSLVLVKDRISTDVHIQLTDPCDDDIRVTNCGSETTCASSIHQKSFNCSCKPGFFARRKVYPFANTRSCIEQCADIDECVEGDPCPANSICHNAIGSYSCSCKPGFRSIEGASGSNVQKCIEICSPNPCTHGECSTRGDHEFDCRCEAGYRGTFCDLQDENLKRAKTNTVIVGVVLGGVLLISFILFAVCVSRLKKKKCLENPGNLYYNSAEMTERRRAEGGAINNAFQRE